MSFLADPVRPHLGSTISFQPCPMLRRLRLVHRRLSKPRRRVAASYRQLHWSLSARHLCRETPHKSTSLHPLVTDAGDAATFE